MKRACCLALILFLAVVAAMAQETSTQAPSTAASANSSQSTPQDISAAKAAHKVWVNLDTGVYHKSGRWYGKTKNGKFMTEDEAKKAGYKAAKRD